MKAAEGHISYVILGVYVDDIVPVSNDPVMLRAEKATLCEKIEMVDQGEIHYLLGMSIKRDKKLKTLTMGTLRFEDVTCLVRHRKFVFG